MTPSLEEPDVLGLFARLGCLGCSLIGAIPTLLVAAVALIALNSAGSLPSVVSDAIDSAGSAAAKMALAGQSPAGASIETVEVVPMAAAANGAPRAEVRIEVALEPRADLSRVGRSVLRAVAGLLKPPVSLDQGLARIRITLDRAGASKQLVVSRSDLDAWIGGRISDGTLAGRW